MALDANSQIVFRNTRKESSQLVFFLLIHGLNGDRILRNGRRQRGNGNAAAFQSVSPVRVRRASAPPQFAPIALFTRVVSLPFITHMAQALFLLVRAPFSSSGPAHQRYPKAPSRSSSRANIGVGQVFEHAHACSAL